MAKIFFFKKRRTTFVEHPTGDVWSNFSSKASVTFSNSAGRHEKVEMPKKGKNAKKKHFLIKKKTCLRIFVPAMVNILIFN